MQHLRLAETPAPITTDTDKFHEVRPFLNAVNANFLCAIKPGRTLCVDEMMSVWHGLDQRFTVSGIPHSTKIKDKPEGVRSDYYQCIFDLQI